MSNESKKIKTVAIIAGGEKSELRGIENADFIITCDKGYNYAAAAGITPDLYVGDGDSLFGRVSENIITLQLPVEKNDTDLMAAVRCSLEKILPENFIFYCAGGGRYDHFLGNLQAACYAAKRGAKVKIIDLYADFYVFSGDESGKKEHTFYRRNGYSFSVLSLTDKCVGVRICGAKYEIENAVITSDFPIGVSNEWKENEIKVSLKSGVLCVCMCKMR